MGGRKVCQIIGLVGRGGPRQWLQKRKRGMSTHTHAWSLYPFLLLCFPFNSHFKPKFGICIFFWSKKFVMYIETSSLHEGLCYVSMCFFSCKKLCTFSSSVSFSSNIHIIFYLHNCLWGELIPWTNFLPLIAPQPIAFNDEKEKETIM